MLAEHEFPGIDAAVVFVPECQKPSAEVGQVLQGSGQQRWYPVPGGHYVKLPWHCSEGNESLFEKEEKGWDHEHCDFCSSHVNIGDRCWTADSGDGGFWVICPGCYEKVKQ